MFQWNNLMEMNPVCAWRSRVLIVLGVAWVRITSVVLLLGLWPPLVIHQKKNKIKWIFTRASTYIRLLLKNNNVVSEYLFLFFVSFFPLHFLGKSWSSEVLDHTEKIKQGKRKHACIHTYMTIKISCCQNFVRKQYIWIEGLVDNVFLTLKSN